MQNITDLHIIEISRLQRLLFLNNDGITGGNKFQGKVTLTFEYNFYKKLLDCYIGISMTLLWINPIFELYLDNYIEVFLNLVWFGMVYGV